MNKSTIKEILKTRNIRPNKVMGQNFLINQKALEKIIQAADLSKDDVVLEIGPGLGILTKELAKNTKKVIAIEKDQEIAKVLKEILEDYNNVEIVREDILKFDLKIKNYKVVANIPYYLTSPLIRMLLESDNPPQDITLLMQKEVAQRVCARPPKTNLLAVSVQLYSKPKIISYVSKQSFWPQPKVDSAIIRIANIQKPDIDIKKFFKVVKAGFSSPRKQLINNLSKKLKIDKEEIGEDLTRCRLDTRVRAENLSLENWFELLAVININHCG